MRMEREEERRGLMEGTSRGSIRWEGLGGLVLIRRRPMDLGSLVEAVLRREEIGEQEQEQEEVEAEEEKVDPRRGEVGPVEGRVQM